MLVEGTLKVQEERAVQLNKSIINKCMHKQEKCATFFCFQESDEEDLFDDLVVASLQITVLSSKVWKVCDLCNVPRGTKFVPQG